MIPAVNTLTNPIEEVTYPGRTYKINFYADIINKNRTALGLKNSALTVLPSSTLGGFTLSDDGTLTLSYNSSLAGYELTQDNGGVLGISLSTNLEEMDRISGFIDDIEAVIQAIYLILSTERYKYIIYSWDYGVELLDLFGKPIPYVIAELPRRITEALTQDDRIMDVVDFEFEANHHKLHTTFTVNTTLGNISTQMEVAI